MKIKKIVEIKNRSEYDLLVKKANYKGYTLEAEMDYPFKDSDFPILILLMKKEGNKVMNFVKNKDYERFFNKVATDEEVLSVDEYLPYLVMEFTTDDKQSLYYSLIDTKNDGEIVDDEAYARLNPEDAYNEMFGIALCIARKHNDTVAEKALMKYMYGD